MEAARTKVIITGVGGQDGFLMAKHLLKTTSHKIVGVFRSYKSEKYEYFKDEPNFKLVRSDISNREHLTTLIKDEQPDYFINFAGESETQESWGQPIWCFESNVMGVLNCLRVIETFQPACRFFNAGSSEEFGSPENSPQEINDKPSSRNIYGASKIAAHEIVKVYREERGLFAVQAVLYGHESSYKSNKFFTKKSCEKLKEIKDFLAAGLEFKPLQVGNLESLRDWSCAENFVKSVWDIMRLPAPKDYILASGYLNSCRDFLDCALEILEIKGEWIEEGFGEYFISNGKIIIETNEEFFRQKEPVSLCGDCSDAIIDFGFDPECDLKELVGSILK